MNTSAANWLRCGDQAKQKPSRMSKQSSQSQLFLHSMTLQQTQKGLSFHMELPPLLQKHQSFFNHSCRIYLRYDYVMDHVTSKPENTNKKYVDNLSEHDQFCSVTSDFDLPWNVWNNFQIQYVYTTAHNVCRTELNISTMWHLLEVNKCHVFSVRVFNCTLM